MQNTANQRPPAICRVDHNKSADRLPVRRETRTRLSDPSPCQHRHLLTNTLFVIVIDYCNCSVCRRGRPSSPMVCPTRRRSLIRRERQKNIGRLTLTSKLRNSPGRVPLGRDANTIERERVNSRWRSCRIKLRRRAGQTMADDGLPRLQTLQ